MKIPKCKFKVGQMVYLVIDADSEIKPSKVTRTLFIRGVTNDDDGDWTIDLKDPFCYVWQDDGFLFKTKRAAKKRLLALITEELTKLHIRRNKIEFGS